MRTEQEDCVVIEREATSLLTITGVSQWMLRAHAYSRIQLPLDTQPQ